MSQNLANELIKEFQNITGIQCTAKYMKNGKDHKPTSLTKDEKGVYVFFSEDNYFKVGKAGSNSSARWKSQHYSLGGSTLSTFPKSIVKNKERFKGFFSVEKHVEIDRLSSDTIKEWICENVSRLEFKISSSESDYALIQFRLKPKYEGRK